MVQDDEEDIKAFLRHENEELAREVKDFITALGGHRESGIRGTLGHGLWPEGAHVDDDC